MKVLIIEDERNSALQLERLLRSLRPDVEIVGITTNIPSSVHAIETNPDLNIIFSDITIDDGLSFSIFEKVQTEATIVFTTAFDGYALKAFDYNCVDYLMKPVSLNQLERALKKYGNRTIKHNLSLARSAGNDIRFHKIANRRILLTEKNHEIIVCNVNDVCYIYSDLGITKVFTSDRNWGKIEMSLSELMDSLSHNQFFRINRQTIVNIDMVHGFIKKDGKGTAITMKDPYSNIQFPITPDKKKALIQMIEEEQNH